MTEVDHQATLKIVLIQGRFTYVKEWGKGGYNFGRAIDYDFGAQLPFIYCMQYTFWNGIATRLKQLKLGSWRYCEGEGVETPGGWKYPRFMSLNISKKWTLVLSAERLCVCGMHKVIEYDLYVCCAEMLLSWSLFQFSFFFFVCVHFFFPYRMAPLHCPLSLECFGYLSWHVLSFGSFLASRVSSHSSSTGW